MVYKPDLRAQFRAHCIVTEDGCWEWQGSAVDGYGTATPPDGGGTSRYVHRIVWWLFVGPVPSSATLDHLCHTADPTCPGGTQCRHRRCVNPAHLQPVLPAVNSRRMQRRAAGVARSRTRAEAADLRVDGF